MLPTTKMMEKQKSLEDELYFVGLVFLPVGILCAFVFVYLILPHLPEAPCLFWKYFGIYCPGCGGTRAVICLLHGRILQSAWYHPLVVYGVFMYAAFMISHTLYKLHIIKKGMKFREGYMYGALFILVMNFLLKNILKFSFGIVMI